MSSTTSPADLGNTLPVSVFAATATLPGLSMIDAVQRIDDVGIYEPALGRLQSGHVQLCPQNAGSLDESMCEVLVDSWPGIHFRPHANVRVLPRLRLFDASSSRETADHMFALVADRCRRLRSPAYTIHAGYKANATLRTMIDTVKRLQDSFPCPVGVEGLYPRDDQPQLMSTWGEYEAVLSSGIGLAIDLSHLHIVATREGRNDDLVGALLASPTTIEVHLSGNSGRRDSHDRLDTKPWWWPHLAAVNPKATIFSEGNQFR